MMKDKAWKDFDFVGTIGYIDGFHEIIFRAPLLPDRKKEHWVDRSAAPVLGSARALAETSFARSAVPSAWEKKSAMTTASSPAREGAWAPPEMRSRA